MKDIYGAVGREPSFRAAFADALRSLWSRGTKTTLEDYVGARAA
jgi:mannitol 2-dehydrogenase